MAKTVDTMPATGKIGPPPKYPWDEWLNGETWELVQGTDFHTASSSNFATYALRMIKRRELDLRVVVRGPVVWIGPGA
jgi:hypothetical protein